MNLILKSKEELIEILIRTAKERDDAVSLIEGTFASQRLTENDNKVLRRKINLNASLFNKLIQAKQLQANNRIKGVKELTDEECIKKNGGIHFE